jgi:hypothetical protein
VAGPGMFANMPVGSLHSFKNETDRPARMLISVAPAGLEKMFFEVGQPVPAGATTAPPPTKEELDTGQAGRRRGRRTVEGLDSAGGEVRRKVAGEVEGIVSANRKQIAMARNLLRTGKKTRPKTVVKGKRYHCAMCRK